MLCGKRGTRQQACSNFQSHQAGRATGWRNRSWGDHSVSGIEITAGHRCATLEVNTGEHAIQLRGHAHFFETKRVLRFDRVTTPEPKRIPVPSPAVRRARSMRTLRKKDCYTRLPRPT